MPQSSKDLLPRATIELGLIGAITDADNLIQIRAAGIGDEDFLVYFKPYEFVKMHLTEYKVVPTHDQMTARFGEWSPPEGDFRFWLDEMVRHTLAHKAQAAVMESLDSLASHPETAIRQLVDRLSGIGTSQSTEIQATDANIGERIERFRYRAEIFQQQKGAHVWGIPTGLRIIDGTHQGWMPGELIGFYARPTVGKTWMLVRAGAIAWMYPNNRILLISPEMPASQMALRVDTLLAGQMQMAFSHHGVYTGNPQMLEAYTGLAGVVQKHERWWTVDNVAGRTPTVSDIAVLQRTLKPNLILIDGVSLLRDERRGQAAWEEMRNICYDLKAFATASEVAIIVSHQAVNTRRGQRSGGDVAIGRGDDWVMPSLNDAAFGDSFVQACSTIFTMCPDRDETRMRWYSIRKSRERDIEYIPRMALAWDVDRGRIIDLGRQDDPTVLQRDIQAALV